MTTRPQVKGGGKRGPIDERLGKEKVFSTRGRRKTLKLVPKGDKLA